MTVVKISIVVYGRVNAQVKRKLQLLRPSHSLHISALGNDLTQKIYFLFVASKHPPQTLPFETFAILVLFRALDLLLPPHEHILLDREVFQLEGVLLHFFAKIDHEVLELGLSLSRLAELVR